MKDIILELVGISKSFTDADVLNKVSLQVSRGEFITLLGSSGCGKTTTLRIIAGLETPDEGRILLMGKDVTDTPPEKRDVNTVFQNYALFPHMDVFTNVAYGLKLKGLAKPEIEQEVTKALELVQLSEYKSRMPSELSGGQRQRVAIARALVNRPHVLLLDEPLGALDLQLRRQMQLELKQLQQQLGITFIYITHDQEEALNMSTRIAVMRDGNFEQIGTPDEVYNFPKTSYVAKFVGNANILCGKVTKCDKGLVYAEVSGTEISAVALGKSYEAGSQIALAVRSESIEFCTSGIEAEVTEASFTGGMLRIALKLSDGTQLIASRHGINLGLKIGEKTFVCFSAQNAVPTLHTEGKA